MKGGAGGRKLTKGGGTLNPKVANSDLLDQKSRKYIFKSSIIK